MNVKEIMTPAPAVCRAETPLQEVARTMVSCDCGAIPVVGPSGTGLVGIVTDRDIVARAVADNRDLRTATVADVASRDVFTVGPEDDLEEAQRLMADQQVRRLPVVEDGRVVGILAQADVALTAKGKDSGEMLEEISKPTSTPRS